MFQKHIKTTSRFTNVLKHGWKDLIFARYSTKSSNKFEPLKDEDRIFTNLYGRHCWHLSSAICRGDWHKTKEILLKGPKWIVNELINAGIRGRGGACYPLGDKLKYMLKSKASPPRYVVINGAEGEPGTCKDREIMRHEPHKLIEGALLVGRAISATEAWIFVRGRFYHESCNLQMALAEAYEAGLVGKNACGSGFDFDIYIQRGAGKYISGEETALINCLMGAVGVPHKKPPYPSEKGIWDQPTTLLNLESASIVPTICRRGSKWFSKLGVWPHSPGARLFNISGHVEKPCTVEESLGIPIREMIERHAGGVKGGWDNLLAVIPGGFSTAMLGKEACENVNLDSESLMNYKSSLGTGAIIVLDKSHDILDAFERILRFYKQSTCRQCSRCRAQTAWGYELCVQFHKGIGHKREIDFLWEVSEWAPKNTICGFSGGNSKAIQGFILNFRSLVEQRFERYG